MKTLNYHKNYNNKLNCEYYTTVRPLKSDIKPGDVVSVTLDRKPLHKATAVTVRQFPLLQLNDFITCLDAGMKMPEFIKKYQEWYPECKIEKEKVVMVLFQVASTVSATEALVAAETVLDSARTDIPTNEKIALFCRYFEQYNGVKYKISRAETGMIKTVEITEDLLQRYFTCSEWWCKVKSVTNYVKNYNQIRVLEAGTGASGHPNQWDAGYAKKLSGPELSEYYKHLRSIGLVAKKNRRGDVVDWVPSGDGGRKTEDGSSRIPRLPDGQGSN